MEAEKISVIIPVYNTEKYLQKCVESVCAQTYRNLEIILVDDGSTDGSAEVCRALAARDSRITVISRKNGGAAAARNTGLDIATGEYVGFIDSDDHIEPDMYEKLYNALTEADADMSECDFFYVDEEGNTLAELPPICAGVRNCREALELVTFGEESWRYISLVNRLYRRKLFDSYRLKEGKICEDEFSAHPIYSQCQRVIFISDVLYWDVCRPNSVMTSPLSAKFTAYPESMLERYEFFRDKGWKDMAKPTLHRAYTGSWLVITHVNAWEYRERLRPIIRRVAEKKFRSGDALRALCLVVKYRLEERKGRAASRKAAAG